jgi:hypothetical protein
VSRWLALVPPNNKTGITTPTYPDGRFPGISVLRPLLSRLSICRCQWRKPHLATFQMEHLPNLTRHVFRTKHQASVAGKGTPACQIIFVAGLTRRCHIHWPISGEAAPIQAVSRLPRSCTIDTSVDNLPGNSADCGNVCKTGIPTLAFKLEVSYH